MSSPEGRLFGPKSPFRQENLKFQPKLYSILLKKLSLNFVFSVESCQTDVCEVKRDMIAIKHEIDSVQVLIIVIVFLLFHGHDEHNRDIHNWDIHDDDQRIHDTSYYTVYYVYILSSKI